MKVKEYLGVTGCEKYCISTMIAIEEGQKYYSNQGWLEKEWILEEFGDYTINEIDHILDIATIKDARNKYHKAINIVPRLRIEKK